MAEKKREVGGSARGRLQHSIGLIKMWLGGVRKLRILLDQEHVSTIEWTRADAIEAYRSFYERHGMTPDQARQQYDRKGRLSQKVSREARRISVAVAKYAGGSTSVRSSLGITLVRKTKWSRETLLAETRAIVADYGLAPVQLLHDHRSANKLLPEDVSQHLTQLVDTSLRVFGSTTAVLEEIGFNPLFGVGEGETTLL